ncbi:hypothetical protein E2C01_036385 [Portunus trituberculatus]|uniref:Uncharacterized protein n=1 Tax=Portunus trituberculatus TaxID=210409 RepID=A0A5B7FE18_PORTR|nr:hypothetical protein [Portunus trituberculatus]
MLDATQPPPPPPPPSPPPTPPCWCLERRGYATWVAVPVAQLPVVPRQGRQSHQQGARLPDVDPYPTPTRSLIPLPPTPRPSELGSIFHIIMAKD